MASTKYTYFSVICAPFIPGDCDNTEEEDQRSNSLCSPMVNRVFVTSFNCIVLLILHFVKYENILEYHLYSAGNSIQISHLKTTCLTSSNCIFLRIHRRNKWHIPDSIYSVSGCRDQGSFNRHSSQSLMLSRLTQVYWRAQSVFCARLKLIKHVDRVVNSDQTHSRWL